MVKYLTRWEEMKKVFKEEIENGKRVVRNISNKSRKFNKAMDRVGTKAMQVGERMDKSFERIIEVYGGEKPPKKKEQHE